MQKNLVFVDLFTGEDFRFPAAQKRIGVYISDPVSYAQRIETMRLRMHEPNGDRIPLFFHDLKMDAMRVQAIVTCAFKNAVPDRHLPRHIQI